MKLFKIAALTLCLSISYYSFSQEVPEGGEDMISKEQANAFRNQKRVESLFFDANKAKITDNPGEAIHLFNKVIELDPRHDASWFELGLLYYKQRGLSRAIQHLSKAYELNPDNKWYSITLANLYSQNAQFDQALAIHKKLYATYPNERSYAIELSNLYIKLNKTNDALQVLNEIQAREGISEEISLRKHHIYLSEGKKKKALEEMETLGKAYEWDTKIQSLLAEFYMANGMDEKALATYQKILNIEPENPYVNISLADYYRKKGDLKKSTEALKKGFSNQYLDATTKLQIMSTYYSQTGNYVGIDADIADLSEILAEQHPFDPQVLAFRAQLLAMQEKYPESLSLFKKVNELDPGKYEVWENVLRITALMEKYDSLILQSAQAMELFPVQPMPYYFNAVGYFMQKKYDEALVSLNKGVKLVFNNNLLMADFYSIMGDTYHSLNSNAEAFSSYENALRYSPDNAVVLNNYAYYLSLENKELEKAKRMAARANELSPDNPTYLDTYAWVLYKSGAYEEALPLMQKVMQLDPDPSGVVMEHYGDILYKANKKEEALEWWNKAAAAGDASELLPKKIKDNTLYE